MITRFDLQCRWSRRLGALILVLVACALPHVARLRAERRPGVLLRQDAAVESLLRQALVAVNSHNPRQLASVAAPNALQSFAWVAGSTTASWQADLLTLPTPRKPASAAGDRPVCLAVFHAWHTCESDGDHIHPVISTNAGWQLGPEIPEADPGGFRIRDHDLNVTFDIPAKSVSITDQVRVECTDQSIPAFCLLRMSQDFRVRQCSVDGKPVPVQQAGGALLITPPPARTFTLGLRYSGVVNHKASDYILAYEATLDSYWYLHTARLPATSTVTVTAPPGWIPIAQGELTQRQHTPDGGERVTYRNDLPNSFFTVDVGRYHVTTRQAAGHTLAAYLLRDDPAFAAACLNRLQRALVFYEARFSRFPYTHYTVVETRGSFDGALEAYSFATFQAGELPGSIQHELAHTWWGGLIPCTYTRSMWDEAFAVYSDALFERLELKQNGEEAYSGRRAAHSYGNGFDAIPLVHAFDTSDQGQVSVGYDKGGRVMRVLEEQIGQETLMRCLQAFLAGHVRGEAGDWDEFERAVNRVTGQNLRWFFAQWVDRPGLPLLRLTHINVQPDAGGYRIEADISQPTPPYRLRVPIALQTRGNDPVATVIEADGPVTHIRLHAATAPTHLTLDPHDVLPLASANDLSYDFTNL